MNLPLPKNSAGPADEHGSAGGKSPANAEGLSQSQKAHLLIKALGLEVPAGSNPQPGMGAEHAAKTAAGQRNDAKDLAPLLEELVAEIKKRAAKKAPSVNPTPAKGKDAGARLSQVSTKPQSQKAATSGNYTSIQPAAADPRAVSDEHPAVTALMIAKMPTQTATKLLQSLPPQQARLVALHLARPKSGNSSAADKVVSLITQGFQSC